MLKSSIGELKLSPLKEDGMFVFYNDFITINGKVSKGDEVKIFIPGYEEKFGRFHITKDKPCKASLVVRGQQKWENDITGYETLDRLYDHVTAVYKEHFYFGDQQS